MKTYNVGIIGFGFIGKVHAYAYINLPFFYEPVPLTTKITHICTSRVETAEKGCKMLGVATGVTDFRQVAENPDIDIVHICTPNHLHKDALLSAMKSQKHIYCDKPLVATINEAEEIRSALGRYKKTAQMTMQIRFFPAVMRAKQLIDEGFIGQILEFRCCFLHSGSVDPDTPLKWKLSAGAGGGVIADLGSHAIDLMHFLAGDFSSVLAATHTAYPVRPSSEDPSRKVKVDAEDCAMLLVRMKSGAIGNIEATKLATGAEDEMRFEIHGTGGAIRYNQTDPHHLEIYDQTAPGEPTGGIRGWTRIDTGQRYPAPASGFPNPKLSIGWLRSHAACLANFLQSIADGSPGNPGLEQGIYVQRIMDCARRSAKQKEWIKV